MSYDQPMSWLFIAAVMIPLLAAYAYSCWWNHQPADRQLTRRQKERSAAFDQKVPPKP